MRQKQAEQPPWVALGRLFITLDSASFLKESLGRLKDQALNLQSLSYSRTKYAALNYNSPLAPHLNVSRVFQTPTTHKLQTLTSLALCVKPGAELSVDTANALRYSDSTLSSLVRGVHPNTGLEFACL